MTKATKPSSHWESNENYNRACNIFGFLHIFLRRWKTTRAPKTKMCCWRRMLCIPWIVNPKQAKNNKAFFDMCLAHCRIFGSVDRHVEENFEKRLISSYMKREFWVTGNVLASVADKWKDQIGRWIVFRII